MNRKTSSIGIAENTWQVLGELEIKADAEPELSTWLIGIFSELNLGPDFQDKVIQSAYEGVSRIILAGTTRRFKHLHLIIFVSAGHALNEHNWAFYKIEKFENRAGNSKPDHSIEFYLYKDGK
jgi:hypothetical protein